MPIETFLKKAKKLEIQAYRPPKNFRTLRDTHVAFTGSPLKHPYDAHKVIVVTDPYSSSTFYYEFFIDDISYVEELPNVTNLEGETVTMARVWVKKRSLAVRCSPFVVEDTRFRNRTS